MGWRFFLIVVMVLLAIRALGRLFGGVVQGARGGHAGAPRGPGRAPVKLTQDPVCGTYVPPRPPLSISAAGTTHYFCSERCLNEFRGRG